VSGEVAIFGAYSS